MLPPAATLADVDWKVRRYTCRLVRRTRRQGFPAPRGATRAVSGRRYECIGESIFWISRGRACGVPEVELTGAGGVALSHDFSVWGRVSVLAKMRVRF